QIAVGGPGDRVEPLEGLAVDVDAERRAERRQRQIALLERGQKLLEASHGRWVAAALAQLGQDALGADLVQLVEGDEEPTLGALVDPAVPGDQGQDATVLDAPGQGGEGPAGGG